MRRWRAVSTWPVEYPRSAPGERVHCQAVACPLPGSVIPEGATCTLLYDMDRCYLEPHDQDNRRYACAACTERADDTQETE